MVSYICVHFVGFAPNLELCSKDIVEVKNKICIRVHKVAVWIGILGLEVTICSDLSIGLLFLWRLGLRPPLNYLYLCLSINIIIGIVLAKPLVTPGLVTWALTSIKTRITFKSRLC